MTIKETFDRMESNITPDKAAKLKGKTFLFDVAGSKCLADFNLDEAPYVREVVEAEAECTITVASEEDWVDIVNQKLPPTTAFMQGKLKVKGNMATALKLQALL